MTATSPDDTIIPPRPATHVWCTLCRAVRPIRAEVIPVGSRPTMGGRFDGDFLRCGGCGSVAATVLIQTEGAS